MEISGASSPAATGGAIAVKVQKQTEDLQQETAQTLLNSVPDPTSTLGQNINVRA